MRHAASLIELDRADLAAGTPLAFDIYDLGGEALLSAGTTLKDDAERAFLFEHFRPARQGDPGKTAPLPFGDALTLDRMALSIGATVGIRRRVGSTRAMQRCRLIGYDASQSVFLAPLNAADLEIVRGDDVEAIAIGRAAVFRFVATVDAVYAEPAPFLTLSPPGFAECLRMRAEPRVPVRIAARCSGGPHGEETIGIVRDISLSGMSIATRATIAMPGEPLRVWLPWRDGARIEPLALHGAVRHVRADPAASGLMLHHVAYDPADGADTGRLKALLYERLAASTNEPVSR